MDGTSWPRLLGLLRGFIFRADFVSEGLQGHETALRDGT